jgi:hypothetical protein
MTGSWVTEIPGLPSGQASIHKIIIGFYQKKKIHPAKKRGGFDKGGRFSRFNCLEVPKQITIRFLSKKNTVPFSGTVK